MQKRIILFLTGLLFLLPVIAKEYTVDNLPNVHLQNEYRYTINPDGVIDTQSQNTIDRLCRTLEDSTGIETVVAIVNSIGNEDCFDFCHELLNSWGVGQKGKDNGLVVLLVTDQRCVQFYTGYGLEGILPDAICKRIQTEQMIPYLKDEKWSEGMVAGMEAVYKRLITYNEGDVSQKDEDDDDLADALTKIVIREGKEKGKQLTKEQVKRINAQFEAETLYKVEAIDWDVVNTSGFEKA
jgi:uncharacterized protein